MEREEEIRRLTEGVLTDGQFLVDVVVSAKRGPRKILVVVDGDQGVGIDDCARISRELSKGLDEMKFPDDRYLLEVTTPGVDQPLKLKRQYRKHIGRRVKVTFNSRIVEGLLTRVDEDAIVVVSERGKGKDKETVDEAIAFADIEKTFVMISFK